MQDTDPANPPSGAQRALMRRLGLSDGALPEGGNWYPEDTVLQALLDLAEQTTPQKVAMLNGGLAVAVLARALRNGGRIWLVEHDPQIIDVTQRMLARVGDRAPVTVVEAELQDYDKHHLWYDRWMMHKIPDDLDLLFIDGPPHFCGRMPRWPAGRELFHKLAPGGRVVLDKARRVKEKKALQRWADEFPHFAQGKLKGGAAILTAG